MNQINRLAEQCRVCRSQADDAESELTRLKLESLGQTFVILHPNKL